MAHGRQDQMQERRESSVVHSPIGPGSDFGSTALKFPPTQPRHWLHTRGCEWEQGDLRRQAVQQANQWVSGQGRLCGERVSALTADVHLPGRLMESSPERCSSSRLRCRIQPRYARHRNLLEIPVWLGGIIFCCLCKSRVEAGLDKLL